MNPRDFKRFNIKNQEEALMVLGSLIALVKVNLEKYTTYRGELEQLVEIYRPLGLDQETLIPAPEYENINDKLIFRQREMLKYCSDQQKDSFSYIHLRNEFVKRQFLKTELAPNISAILNRFLDIRNWTFHNTQSSYTAYMEVANKSLSNNIKGFVTSVPQIKPIIIDKIEFYDFPLIATGLLHADQIKHDFTLVLQSMVSDYKEMYKDLGKHQIFIPGGDSNLFFERKRTKRFMDQSLDCLQILTAIQKGKYTGCQEDFDKIAIFNRDKGKNK